MWKAVLYESVSAGCRVEWCIRQLLPYLSASSVFVSVGAPARSTHTRCHRASWGRPQSHVNLKFEDRFRQVSPDALPCRNERIPEGSSVFCPERSVGHLGVV